MFRHFLSVRYIWPVSEKQNNNNNNITQTSCNNQDFLSLLENVPLAQKKKRWIKDNVPCSYGWFQVLCRGQWSLPSLDPNFLLSFSKCRWEEKDNQQLFLGPCQFKSNLQYWLFKIDLPIPKMMVLLPPIEYLCGIFLFAPVSLLDCLLWVANCWNLCRTIVQF